MILVLSLSASPIVTVNLLLPLNGYKFTLQNVNCDFHNVCIQVNPELIEEFESKNMIFVGHDEAAQRMEMLELKGTYVLYSVSCE